MPGSVTADWLGQLATLDGETVTVAAMDNTYSPPTATVALSSMSGELDTATTDAAWSAMTATLNVDDFTGMDAADVAWWAIAYGGDVVTSIEVGTPVTVTASDTVSFPNGVAQAIRGNDLSARVTTVENALDGLVAGATVPDPSGGSDGDVLTVDSGSYILAAPTGGGGGGAAFSWLDDGASLATYLTESDGTSGPNLIRAMYLGAATPAVATGPAPVLLGVVQAAHRPAGARTGVGHWFDGSSLDQGTLRWIVDHDGGMLGTAGGLWVQDATGTLADSDDVSIDLTNAIWTPAA